TGRWPQDLEGLPAFIRAREVREVAPAVKERLNRVLEFHLQEYERIRILSQDGTNCTFVIYLHRATVRAQSSANDRIYSAARPFFRADKAGRFPPRAFALFMTIAMSLSVNSD